MALHKYCFYYLQLRARHARKTGIVLSGVCPRVSVCVSLSVCPRTNWKLLIKDWCTLVEMRAVLNHRSSDFWRLTFDLDSWQTDGSLYGPVSHHYTSVQPCNTNAYLFTAEGLSHLFISLVHISRVVLGTSVDSNHQLTDVSKVNGNKYFA